jgi:hypothetical protein
LSDGFWILIAPGDGMQKKGIQNIISGGEGHPNQPPFMNNPSFNLSLSIIYKI